MKFQITTQKVFDGSRIGLGVVSKMTKKHRAYDPLKKKLHYSHFTVTEIIELFKDNNVLPAAICEQLSTPEALDHMKKHGLKIYLGKHEKSTCPPGNPGYDKYTTTILCNTEIERGKHKYRDLVDNNKHSILMSASRTNDPDPYLDQTNICPPDSPDPGTLTTQDSIYDIANYRNP